VEEILAGHGKTIGEWLGGIDEQVRQLNLRPWALVLFDRECPLMDYLLSTRADFGDYMGLSYSGPARQRTLAGAAPLAGVLIINKFCLSPIYEGDDPYESIWSQIEDLDPKRRWLCLVHLPESVPAPNPSAGALAEYQRFRLERELARPHN